MPLPVNTIDVHSFICLEGHPETIKRQLSVFRRAGVDGVQISDDARRGSEFQILSKVDAVDLNAAQQTFLQYRDLIGGDAVGMVWNDWDTGAEGLRFVVLDVRKQVLRRMAASSGGLNPPSGAWLEVVWVMIPVFWS